MFHDITCKLGNMRKAVEWTICPIETPDPETVIIQCDKRIASVNMKAGKAILSSGKGGHPGFVMLNASLGATVVDVPSDVMVRLTVEVAKMTANYPKQPEPTDPLRVCLTETNAELAS